MDVATQSHKPRWRTVLPCRMAILGLATVLPPLTAVLLQWLLQESIRPYVWFLFYPAVFASSWIGGKGAGLMATAISAVTVWYFFVPPQYAILKPDASLFPALVFVAMGIAFSLFHARLRRSESFLSELFDRAGDGIFVADLEGKYTHVNDAGLRMLGYTSAELLGQRIVDLIPAEDVARLELAKERLLAGHRDVAEWRLRRKDGSYVPVEIAANILHNGWWQAFVRDISERQHAQARLRWAGAVFDNTKEAILVTDSERKILTVNPAFTAITGFEPAEVIGADPRLLNSGRQGAEFYRAMWESLHVSGQWQGELWNRRKNGEMFPAWENISAVKDPGGTITHYVSVLSDISAVKVAEEKLRHAAHHDMLTGLANRMLFVEFLEQSMARARRSAGKVALLFIDLDRFKIINDSMGHAAGDELLREVAHRLKAAVRAQDVVARLGGDEFMIVMDDIVLDDDAAGLAQKVITALSKPLKLLEREIFISASVGIALFPDDAQSADDLTRAA
ncbi:MAG TPA: PAS domain S-box protein, partial [Burkholderiaceae bacterium]